jgi:enoyl-CoA hydratase/carnithine racemase
MAKHIIFQTNGAVVNIIINNPQNDNMLDTESLIQVSDICREINDNENYKAVIITGKGSNVFSLGFKNGSIAEITPVSSLIAGLRCPVIAAINGDAFAEGLEIALACDIRIASPNSRFCLPDIQSGGIPSNGGTQRLSRIVGITKAMEMCLTGESIDADEALRIDLITGIVEQKDLIKTANDMAQTMTTKSPLALSYAKEAIYKGLDLTMEQGLQLEADLYFLLHTTEDRVEGIKAFREKRNPDFKGN